MNNLNNLARTGSEALNQTIVDIVFGLSFHHEVQQHLVRHRYTQLMLRMLEQSQGRTSAFLKVAIAIVNFTERSHVRSFVGQQCVSMLLSALTVIVREEVLVLEDQKLLGCFSTTSLEDSHDAASKIYSLHVLYPLSILSSHEEIHESLRGKRFLANLKEFVNMYHRRIISKQVQDTPEAASIMRIVQILSNLQRTPDGQQAIKTSNLPGALVKIFEDQHVEIRGEMCKFVHSCPLLWEEERDKVLPILFSLLGDKSAEVRREAMHAVSEIFHRPDDAFMLQLVDMVEGKPKAKRKSGVGILSILAKQESIRPAVVRFLLDRVVMSADLTQVLWVCVTLEAAAIDEETCNALADSIITSGMFGRLNTSKTILLDTLSMLLYILVHCKTRTNSVAMAEFLLKLLETDGYQSLAMADWVNEVPPQSDQHLSGYHQLQLSSYNNIPVAPLEAVVQLFSFARAERMYEEESFKRVRLEVTRLMTRRVKTDVIQLRKSCIDVLGYIAEPSDREVVSAMIDATMDEDRDISDSAHVALRRMCIESESNGAMPSVFSPVRTPAESISKRTAEDNQEEEKEATTGGLRDKIAQVQVYWSISFRCRADVQEKARSIKDAVVAVMLYDWSRLTGCQASRGLSCLMYSVSSLQAEKDEYDVTEYMNLQDRLDKEMEEEISDLYQKLIIKKSKLVSDLRTRQEDEINVLISKKPISPLFEDAKETSSSVFTGEEEREYQKKDRELKYDNYIRELAIFDKSLRDLKEKHEEELRKLGKEQDEYTHMSMEDREEKLKQKRVNRMAALKLEQEQRKTGQLGQASDELTWSLMKDKISKSDIFVACLTAEFLDDPLASKQLVEAFRRGVRIISIIIDALPGMYDNPGAKLGLPFSGGLKWWPPRRDMARYLTQTPINLAQAGGAIPSASSSFSLLLEALHHDIEAIITKNPHHKAKNSDEVV
mmetsp:Transcript_2529/g.8278  ORF Transcript_2529/g.8278 Transcript_2529/m.8278 type:complete len:946 (+) Transcript_2529:104-2941(+)